MASYYYYVSVTPWNPNPTRTIRRGCRRFDIQRVSPGDASDVSLVISGRINTPRHRQRISQFLDAEGVPPGARDDALALILSLYTNPTTQEADVRIQTVHDVIPEDEDDGYSDWSYYSNGYDYYSSDDYDRIPASRKAVEGLEKLTVDPAASGALGKETSCAVCLDEFETGSEVMRRRCSHVFHGDCLAKWLGNQFVCPVCRFELLCADRAN